MKSFESWIIDDIESVFEIEQNYESEILYNWLKSNILAIEYKKELITVFKNYLLKNVNTFNEDELKMQFIAPFLAVVDFMNGKYKAFSQRSLTLSNDKVETSGIVDFMLARGKSRPVEPLFCLHEYKQQHPSKKNDPLAQLLIAMLAAQSKNNNNQPVYGVLVEGRFWYFIVLHQKEYGVSDAFDATTADIYQIYSILCKLKEYIEEMVKDL